MRHALPAAAFAAALSALPVIAQPSAPPPAPGPQQVRVLNRTGQPAQELHAVREGRGDWGVNLLKAPLPNDDGFGLRTAPAAGCRFDFRMVLADGKDAVLRDQDICAAREIALTPGTIGASAVRGDAPAGRPSPTIGQPQAAANSARPNAQARVASGTGFAVSADVVMTNHHVIDGCDRILVRLPDKRVLAAVPPARVDREIDLALLKVPGLNLPPLAFRTGAPIRRGDGVIAFGFPLAGLLSSDPKLTRGELNGLNGLGDDPKQFQISAEVQPGNSGGPLLDLHGQVVGVVVSKLNAQRVAQRTGDIAQNINFAIKGDLAQRFLDRAGIKPRTEAATGPEMSAADVGDVADNSTVFVRCEK